MPERAFVDANVGIYAAGKPHPARELSIEILALGIRRPGYLWTSAEVLQEILHVYVRREGPSIARRVFTLYQNSMPLTVVDLLVADVFRAASLDVPSRLAARDRVHLAVMERLGITTIISTDAGFDGVAGIRRCDPLRLAEWRDSVFGA